ncbi:MAG: hypothetical protein MUF54_14065 [Polyangiaceae bacterium]|jgi:hypothetical protein|nr:hypothetical protein [Polyangiaceae bacterium]
MGRHDRYWIPEHAGRHQLLTWQPDAHPLAGLVQLHATDTGKSNHSPP